MTKVIIDDKVSGVVPSSELESLQDRIRRFNEDQGDPRLYINIEVSGDSEVTLSAVSGNILQEALNGPLKFWAPSFE